MMNAIGWAIVLLSLIFAKLGILSLVDVIEADDPANPAVIAGFHYPAAAFLYALLIAPLLIVFSILSMIRKESSRHISLFFGIPAVGLFSFFVFTSLLGSA
jgi:hypothetical protein